MDKGIAIARQVQAQEKTAQGVAEMLAALARVEAKQDEILKLLTATPEAPEKPEKPGKIAKPAKPAEPEKKEAGA